MYKNFIFYNDSYVKVFNNLRVICKKIEVTFFSRFRRSLGVLRKIFLFVLNRTLKYLFQSCPIFRIISVLLWTYMLDWPEIVFPVWKKSIGEYWIQYLPILFFHTGWYNKFIRLEMRISCETQCSIKRGVAEVILKVAYVYYSYWK